MIVMPANSTNELVHLWAGRYGGVGHLFTPARTERVRPWLPYALDNGRFAEAVRGIPFDELNLLRHVERYVHLSQKPMFIVVPDVPFEGGLTLQWWDEWAPRLRAYNVPLAMAVQNGMTPVDVRSRLQKGDWVFVGGDYEWKWKTAPMWASEFENVHVGRVNSPVKLYELARFGVKSCDGSGWFRGKAPQVVGLGRFLATQSGLDPAQAEIEARSSRFASTHDKQFCLGIWDLEKETA